MCIRDRLYSKERSDDGEIRILCCKDNVLFYFIAGITTSLDIALTVGNFVIAASYETEVNWSGPFFITLCVLYFTLLLSQVTLLVTALVICVRSLKFIQMGPVC